MELTEQLKEDMAKKFQTRDEAKDNLKESRVVLNEEELDSIVGGRWVKKTTKKDLDAKRRILY